MGFNELAEFIDERRQSIVAEWEKFASTLFPGAENMSRSALRDHADEILDAIIADMKSHQTAAEQARKSKGHGDAENLGDVGTLHASLRIEAGFKIGHMVAEYRALRASVLRLWEKEGTDPGGVTRFNEAIDEALTEAVNQFTDTTEHYRDQSLGILGHDLRNPLGAIISGATLLMNSDELGDRNSRVAARMLNSANRMNRMIGDLLDLTRTRFGDLIPVVRVPMDLEPLCRQVIAELEGSGSAADLQFNPSGDLRGEWDGDRIAQVLSNLLRNAIQHGGTKDPISLNAREDGDQVILEVHNGGGVIPKGIMASLFEPMVRHAGDDQKNAGLGLGLYIAHQVVLAHGGTLEVTSTADDGTTFTARMPRQPLSASLLVLRKSRS